MKNRILIILSFIVLVGLDLQGQSVLNKRIYFSAKNLSISKTLLKLSNENNINIVFSSAFFDSEKKIDINKLNRTIDEILMQILKNSNISYKENNGSILLINTSKSTYNIFGYINDIESGEVLPGANIIDLKTGIGVISNGYGYYCLELPKGETFVQFSYLGSKITKLKINLKKDKSSNILMHPSNFLNDIIIVSSKEGKYLQESTNQNNILIKRINTFSVAGGEPDLLRQLGKLPGVQSGVDGFGGLHVRGGNADQNLILLDDVPIFNPSHSIGLFSIFNPSVIKNVLLTKGGFPARYGGRLSSVLEIRTKDGNMIKPTATIGVSVIASSATIEVPIIKNKMSILLSARRSHLDNYLKNISRKTKESEGKFGQTDYHFLDLNAKINFKLSNNDRFYLSIYGGSDSFEDITHNEFKPTNEEPRIRKDSLIYTYNWGNKVMSFRWNHLFSKKIFLNTSLIYSNFNYKSKFINKNSYFAQTKKIEERIRQNIFKSAVEDLSIRSDFDYFLNKKHRIKCGLGITQRKLTPSILDKQDIYNFVDSSQIYKTPIAVNNINYKGYELYGYLNDQINLGNFEFNSGLHFASFVINNDNNYSIQPRFTTKYHFNKSTTVSISTSKMTQFLHLLSTTDSGLPSDLWVPSINNAKPENSWISTLGFQHKIKNKWILNAEIYSKTMSGMQYYIDSVFSLNNQDINVSSWEEIVNSVDGKSIGLEILLEKYTGKFTGWISYTLSKSTRSISGNILPYKFSSLNSFHTQLSYAFTNKISFNLGWSYHSGLPADQHKQAHSNFLFADLFNSNTIDIKNNRLPAYHKLDLGINIHLKFKKTSHNLSLGVYNLYNRKNVLFIFRKGDDSNQWIQINSLPIIPSFRYELIIK